MTGPPTEPDTWASASGMSTGLTPVNVLGVTQLGTDGGQKFAVENRSACMAPGRPRNIPSPCSVFVPDLVTMLSAGPAVQPNSEENAFDSTVISWIAPTGTVAIAVWRPHASSLFAPSSVVVVVRREPAPVAKYVWLTKRSPVPFACRNAAFRSGSVEIFRPRIGVSSITGLS